MNKELDFDTRYKFALNELKRSPMWKCNYLPLFHKLMRKWGRQSRPPHYNSFFSNTVLLSIYFSLAWGLILWFSVWSSQGVSILVAALSSIAAGTVFGLAMAGYYFYSAKRHSLTKWDELGQSKDA